MSEILTPEDLYGDLVECPECGEEEFSGFIHSDHFECSCGYDSSDDFDPPEPDDYDVYDGPMA